jgi:ribosomal protein S18 acetylase RimI-like enzyme
MTVEIRNVTPDDYNQIITIMPSWWDGRDLTSALLKIFFIHFQNSSFLATEGNKMIGFLIGFISQSNKYEAYIHLLGVDPNYRKKGVARSLYQEFYNVCKASSISYVTSCTSPINIDSIEFHRKMGFEILEGDSIENGIEVTVDYLGNNSNKVLFRKKL